MCRVRALLAAMVLLLAGPAAAQPARGERPIAELPRGVAAAPGALSLVADYRNAAGGQVPVYLVNRTGAAVELETQDGDPYLVREVELDGRWVRAEPFLFSFCGLSYYAVRVEPGHFLTFGGRSPDASERGRVRFRLGQHSVPVVSNVGAGRFSRDEVLAASHDVMAMRASSARGIEDALFRQPPLPQHERRAAFRRLGELPAAEAMPIVLRVLRESASDDDLDEALRAGGALDPSALARHVLGVLDGPSPLRARTLGRLRYASVSDEALERRLLALVMRPDEPELRVVIPLVARTRRPEARAALIAIADDPRYPVQARIVARYQLEQWFSTHAVRVIARPVGDYSGGHRFPVRMELHVTNTSGRAIDFRYGRLSDFMTLYVTRDGRDDEHVLPRASVRWRTTPGNASTAVHLASGEERVFAFDLLDYFDLPAGAQVTVWASVRIPGVHGEIPQLGSGSGVNVQP